MNKRILLVVVLLAGCCVLTTAAAGVAYLALGRPATIPSVLINSPRHGAQLRVGEETTVQAVARGQADTKIKRVELWVDGVLQGAQTSSVAGGISPFPLFVNWQPGAAGPHTLLVRAFDAKNAAASALISVDAISNSDRDHDGVPDALDRCPDQPGPAANGGCPAPATNDRDGDGVIDSVDQCPEQAGSPMAAGCPDADGDTVADASDRCPREFGSPANSGCPLPGDADGDGVPDAGDRCPSVPGDAAMGGCPDAVAASDRDGDGVSDVQDLCPDVPGPAANSGCPSTGTGDRDGDGVEDATDLAPADPGPGGGGGAPPPGGGGDEDGDAIPDEEEPPAGGDEGIPDAGSWEALNLVQIEALSFSTTQDYDHVICYVAAANAAEQYGPFDLISTHQWDIAEYMGGANSRTLAVPVGHALDLRVECQGHYPDDGPFSIVPSDMGSITRSYAENQWDGHEITEMSGMAASERGDAGHSFTVKFRLCARSCDQTLFPAPELHNQLLSIGPLPARHYLAWTWSGNEADITGYRLYVNGNRRASIADSEPNRVRLDSYQPPCGETYEYYVTAYRADGFNIRQSPPSNIVHVQGDPCPRRVKVTFTYMSIAPYLPDDFSCCKGPFYGQFYAIGSEMRSLDWRAGECKAFLWIYSCKTGWDYLWAASVAQIFAGINESAGHPELGAWAMYAPSTDNVIVRVGEHDDLSIGAIIMDEDAYGGDDTRMNAYTTIPAGTLPPRELVLNSGENEVYVRIEELTGE